MFNGIVNLKLLKNSFNKKYVFKIIYILILVLFVSMVYGKEITLRWIKSENINKYILEVSKDRQFIKIDKTIETKENSIKISLDEGLYYIRVAGVSDRGIKGYYSNTRVVEIKLKKKSPPPPAITEINLKENKVARIEKPQKETTKSKAVVENGIKTEDQENKVPEKVVVKKPKKTPEPEKVEKKDKRDLPLRGLMSRRKYWDSKNKIWLPSD